MDRPPGDAEGSHDEYRMGRGRKLDDSSPPIAAVLRAAEERFGRG